MNKNEPCVERIFLYEGRRDVFFEVYRPASASVRPAVLICPGGGYQVVGSTEGRPVAERFLAQGYTAFVLRYSIGDGAVFGPGGFDDFDPVNDARRAMEILRGRAAQFEIDADRIVLAGFSAGGHLASAYCFSGAGLDFLPAALLLTYPMSERGDMPAAFNITTMPFSQEPAVKSLPVFFHHAKDDKMVPFAGSVHLEERLTREGIEHVFLAYDHGVHAQPFANDEWFPKAIAWLKEKGV
ncbi:MAG: alpha/beta hydrolase [Clostridiales Family XIII bacterium]|jgi:acetyl esterase/lipase|nr:alpha/beta hydrolase [Clostridiales Family XIII bacterium]